MAEPLLVAQAYRCVRCGARWAQAIPQTAAAPHAGAVVTALCWPCSRAALGAR
jgi:hypothetical protein